MKLYFHKYGKLFDWIYSQRTWRKKSDAIYLTFDDGPHPEVTPWILQTLKRYNVKATFFCVGENLENHPQLKNQILQQGHLIGNHTQQHNHAKKTTVQAYKASVDYCQQHISNARKLFRPPYGKLPRKHEKALLADYEIVMWSVLSGDFDKNLNPEEVFVNTVRATEKGSIIVFHDNPKCLQTLKEVLPLYIETMQDEEYRFDVL